MAAYIQLIQIILQMNYITDFVVKLFKELWQGPYNSRYNACSEDTNRQIKIYLFVDRGNTKIVPR